MPALAASRQCRLVEGRGAKRAKSDGEKKSRLARLGFVSTGSHVALAPACHIRPSAAALPGSAGAEAELVSRACAGCPATSVGWRQEVGR